MASKARGRSALAGLEPTLDAATLDVMQHHAHRDRSGINVRFAASSGSRGLTAATQLVASAQPFPNHFLRLRTEPRTVTGTRLRCVLFAHSTADPMLPARHSSNVREPAPERLERAARPQQSVGLQMPPVSSPFTWQALGCGPGSTTRRRATRLAPASELRVRTADAADMDAREVHDPGLDDGHQG
jgi:hypothetical protein